MNIKTILLKSAIIASIFTFGDFLFHFFIDILKIDYYSFNWFLITNTLYNYSISKFIATFIFFTIGMFVLSKFKIKDNLWKYVIGSVLIVMLEVRYIYSGYYTNQFHFFNFINHVITLGIAILITEMVVKK